MAKRRLPRDSSSDVFSPKVSEFLLANNEPDVFEDATTAATFLTRFLYRFNTKSLYFCTKLRVRSDRKLHDDSRRIGIAFQKTFYLLQGGMVFVQKARRKPQIITMHGVDHAFKHQPFSMQFY